MTDRDTRHKKAMQKRKEVVDAKVAEAQEERGITIVITGNGKGKTTSAWGTVARSLGYGYKVAVTQFIKGTWDCGERDVFAQDQNLTVHVMGTGFTWETQDRELDTRACREAWDKTLPHLKDPDIHLVVLDEITYMMKYGYLSVDEVLEALRNRPVNQSVILTGRGANKDIQAYADTVSEVKDTKHAFNDGIKARKGIDW
ncbi:cob(I)yrinic acid a,c-diamide adenosyltransferase [Oceanospirillum sediminis]|uniref:Corrinoid adenosyltransferase n=1 Tax=Oceanospirillum sediminis TaxID=2760088 RepID=A0A839IMH9_9GAMM|nr:cob(I)yrinic acid a,c-diamide adenosyltransferase [Oceanospirillum sediminis]MBB1486101.1 cob(I)yrinic acid a,c-diamide adenosyltransferase [Oceanospirillum sediminis]